MSNNSDSAKSVFQNFDIVSDLEWLEPNGFGGWASSTISGANTRKYHGLLVTSHEFSDDRFVLVSGLDETIRSEGAEYKTSCNIYPGTIFPEGYKHLQGFSNDTFPEFIYQFSDVLLKKTIAMVKGRNIALVRYEVLRANGKLQLSLAPLLAVRQHHLLRKASDGEFCKSSFKNGALKVVSNPPYPAFYLQLKNSRFKAGNDWYYRFQYPRELERGEAHEEDLFCPGRFEIELVAGENCTFAISTDAPESFDAQKLFTTEKQRKQEFIDNTSAEDYLVRTLFRITDQFLIRKADDNLRIKSGFFWFTESSRETLIALPGLLLMTSRFRDAREIILKFCKLADRGLVPNQIPYPGQQPLFSSVDAGLWLVNAIYKYIMATEDTGFGINPEVTTAVDKIIGGFYEGTPIGGKVAEDGLVDLGEEPTQTTWMGIKSNNGFVTPRAGKIVEVNALWYNALKIQAFLLKLKNSSKAAETLEKTAKSVKNSFETTFWNPEKNMLSDYVTGSYRDHHIRPNQVLALSLPFPVIDKNIGREVLKTIRGHLLTPVGLRSLSPEHPEYKSRYLGNQGERDQAYHQGSVWPWLLGPYIDAVIRYEGVEGEDEALEIYSELEFHLNEAGITCISEIFDAQMPHQPRGCISYACSVAELLRAGMENNIFELEDFINRYKEQAGEDGDDQNGQQKLSNPFSSISAFRSPSSSSRMLALSRLFSS